VKDNSKKNSMAELELRRLLDNIPAELGILDSEGRFLFNTSTGIHDPEMRQWIIGKNHHEYCEKRGLPRSFADNRQKQIDKCIAEKKLVTFEEPIMDKDGNLKVYLRMFCPVFDEQGNVAHVIGHGQEITALKKSEKKLRKALEEVEDLK